MCRETIANFKASYCTILFFHLLMLAVKGIKKKDLVEIRTMSNPPPAVKMAVEAICLLLGENAQDWRAIRANIMKDSFVPNIVKMQTQDIT